MILSCAFGISFRARFGCLRGKNRSFSPHMMSVGLDICEMAWSSKTSRCPLNLANLLIPSSRIGGLPFRSDTAN